MRRRGRSAQVCVHASSFDPQHRRQCTELSRRALPSRHLTGRVSRRDRARYPVERRRDAARRQRDPAACTRRSSGRRGDAVGDRRHVERSSSSSSSPRAGVRVDRIVRGARASQQAGHGTQRILGAWYHGDPTQRPDATADLTQRGRFAGRGRCSSYAVTATRFCFLAAARGRVAGDRRRPEPDRAQRHHRGPTRASPTSAARSTSPGANVGGTDYDVYVSSSTSPAPAGSTSVARSTTRRPTTPSVRASPRSAACPGWPGSNTTAPVRAARRKAAGHGDGWIGVVGGADPLNHDPTQNACGIRASPTSAACRTSPGRRPVPNTNEALIRVSRLNADGTAWVRGRGRIQPDQPGSLRAGRRPQPHRDRRRAVRGLAKGYGDPKIHVSKGTTPGPRGPRSAPAPAPINHDPTKYASSPSLTAIGGVPWIAWSESSTT